jgi:putative flippase GtrA
MTLTASATKSSRRTTTSAPGEAEAGLIAGSIDASIDGPMDGSINGSMNEDQAKQSSFRSTALRWLKFNAVGAGGIAVQLAVLTMLRSGLGLGYLPATALAVEAAVIHNYFWHQRFTWVDRETERSRTRFAKFNLTTGLFSIAGNIVLMRIFVGGLAMNYLVANIMTIATCSIVNFVVSDRVVFD